MSHNPWVGCDPILGGSQGHQGQEAAGLNVAWPWSCFQIIHFVGCILPCSFLVQRLGNDPPETWHNMANEAGCATWMQLLGCMPFYRAVSWLWWASSIVDDTVCHQGKAFENPCSKLSQFLPLALKAQMLFSFIWGRKLCYALFFDWKEHCKIRKTEYLTRFSIFRFWHWWWILFLILLLFWDVGLLCCCFCCSHFYPLWMCAEYFEVENAVD